MKRIVFIENRDCARKISQILRRFCYQICFLCVYVSTILRRVCHCERTSPEGCVLLNPQRAGRQRAKGVRYISWTNVNIHSKGIEIPNSNIRLEYTLLTWSVPCRKILLLAAGMRKVYINLSTNLEGQYRNLSFWCMRVWTRLIWLNMRINSGLLWTRLWSVYEVYEIRVISWLP